MKDQRIQQEAKQLRKLDNEMLLKERKKIQIEMMRANEKGTGQKLPPEKRKRFRQRIARINTILKEKALK